MRRVRFGSQVYGEMGFPFQILTLLSRCEEDYTDGGSLLVTRRPRAQSVGEVITLDQGQMLISLNTPNEVAPRNTARRLSDQRPRWDQGPGRST